MTNNRREAVLVFSLLALVFAYFHHDGYWNGNSRLDLVFAAVREGRLTIDSFHDLPGYETGDKSFYNGHYYSDKAIGSSLVASAFYLPLFWLTGLAGKGLSHPMLEYLLTLLSIGLPSALAGALLYLVCRWVAGNRLKAFAVTISVALGTMFFSYSVTFFGHQLAAALLFCAFFLAFSVRSGTARPAKGLFFLFGFLISLAFITEYPTAVIGISLIGYLFVVVRKQGCCGRSLVMTAIGGAIPLAVLLAYNEAAFGSPLSIGYGHLSDPRFAEGMSRGLMGIGMPRPDVLYYLTVHPARGLLWQSPVLALVPLGAFIAFKTARYRLETALALFILAAFLLINSGYYMWWGGWAFGPRHLVPMLPLLSLPLALVPTRWLPPLIVLGVVSVLQMFLVVSIAVHVPDDAIAAIQNLGFKGSTIYGYCLPQMLDGHFAPNLGRALLGLSGPSSLLPLALGACFIAFLFFALKAGRQTETA